MRKMIRAEKVGYIYRSKYQQTKALSEVSCSFEQGKVYAITGKMVRISGRLTGMLIG